MTPTILVSTSGQKLDSYLLDLKQSHTLSHTVSPQGKSISIKDIKELLEKVSLTAGRNEKQLFLIQSGHLMTLPAQNCLLRTLEESRPNQLFLIVTHLPHLLLPTVTSRCLFVHLDSETIDHPSILTGPDLKTWSANPAQIIANTDQIFAIDPTHYLSSCLTIISTLSRKHPTQNRIFIQTALINCLDDLDKNINTKLAIDHFFFSVRHCLSTT